MSIIYIIGLIFSFTGNSLEWNEKYTQSWALFSIADALWVGVVLNFLERR